MPGVLTESPFRQFLWLDLDKLVRHFLPEEFTLARIRYFTSPERGDPVKADRQAVYLRAIETIPSLSYGLGRFTMRSLPNYSAPIRFVRWFLGDLRPKYTEKETDVALAVQAFRDVVYEKELESVVLISGDSDFAPLLKAIKAERPKIFIRVIFPPGRKSDYLGDLADDSHKIGYKVLSASQLPDPVIGLDGSPIYKPSLWTI